MNPSTPASYIRQHVLGLTQAELAKKLGTNQSAVSRWEMRPGQIPEKYRVEVVRIADGFNRPLNIRWIETWFEKSPFA